MGLMGGSNPYFVENPIAAALNGLRSGGMDGYKSALDKRKMDADIANQKDTRAQQQQLIDIQVQAAQQKQAEAHRLDEYRKANLAAQAPVAASVQMPGESMPLGGGLLSGQALQVAPMEQRVMTQPDPVAVQQKQAALYQQYDPEGYGKMMAENAMKPQAMNPLYVKMIEAAQNGSLNEQGQAMLEKAGYGQFTQKPSDKETWSEPFAASIGGKKAMVQKSSYGQVRPVIQDTSTTVRVTTGNGDKPKGRPMPAGTSKVLTSAASMADAMDRFATGFQPEYAGHTLTGGLTTTAGKLFGDSTGQVNFWQDYQGYVNDVRHEQFGAALTPGEKVEFLKYIITESTNPKVAADNLARQKSIVDTALARTSRGYARQYDPATVEEFIGRPIPAAAAGRAAEIPYDKRKQVQPTRPSPGTPKVGEMRGGYMFMGGNPADKKSWGKR